MRLLKTISMKKYTYTETNRNTDRTQTHKNVQGNEIKIFKSSQTIHTFNETTCVSKYEQTSLSEHSKTTWTREICEKSTLLQSMLH